MVVRIRFQQGPAVRRKGRKNRHLALASAALLTPAALTALVLALWRIGADLGFARAFAIRDGLLSHWQIWLAVSVIIQFAAILLNRYGASEAEAPAPEHAFQHTQSLNNPNSVFQRN